MLISSGLLFNQADFDRRLRHYFSDSAPCAVNYKIGLNYVSVLTDRGKSLAIELKSDLSAEENARLVIEKCEDSLYPRVARVSEVTIPLPAGEAVSLLNKGKTLIEIIEKIDKRKKKQFLIVTRIGLNAYNYLVENSFIKKDGV